MDTRADEVRDARRPELYATLSANLDYVTQVPR